MDSGSIIIIIMLLVVAVGAGVAIGLWMRSRKKGTKGPAARIEIGGKTRLEPLPKGRELRIGRESGNDVVVDHHLVSRQHARLVQEGTNWILIDNNSVNGTFVNGRPVTRCVITPDDVVEIGPMRLRLEVPGWRSAGVKTPAPIQGAVVTPGPPATADQRISQQMLGPFAILSNLGEGGIGKVLLANDTRNGRPVALKLLNHDNDFLVQKFQQEGNLKLSHPHIASVIETNSVAGHSYIAMEYVEGANLRKMLHDHHPLSIDIALILMGQILSALGYAHKKGVIHRDIKPENIMISPTAGVKIIDFGIAKVTSTVTRTRDGLIMGTPSYMSYEQARGIPVNPTSDLYAAAIVLYEMLTTKVPFSADNPTEVIRQHQVSQPMPPMQINPAIPVHVNNAILRALEKEVSHRFSSAQEFLTALGCPTNVSLPQDFARLVAQHIPPIRNDYGTGSELATRDLIPSLPVNNHTHILRIKSGRRKGDYIVLNHTQTIGRNDIDPEDGTISRQHLRIEQQGENCILYDTSRHGTAVNGVSLHGGACQIQPGSFIQVGQTVLVYEIA